MGNNGEVIMPANNQEVTIEMIRGKWPEILENVRRRKKSTHAFLIEGKPERLEKHTLIIVFRKGFSFHRDKVGQTENQQTIQDVIQQLLGIRLTLSGIMEDKQVTEAGSGSVEELERQALIKRTVDIFGPEIVVVKEDS